MQARKMIAAALISATACVIGPLELSGKRCTVTSSCPEGYACLGATAATATCVRTYAFRDGVAPSSSYAGTRDTQIVEATPTSPSGSAPVLTFDGDDPPGTWMRRHVLLAWDLSSVPTQAQIGSAFFELTFSNTTDGLAYDVYAVLRPWSEAEATWEQASAGVPWQVPGGTGTLDLGEKVAEVAPDSLGLLRFDLTAEGLTRVQSWVADPSTNHGIMIVGTSHNGGDFTSREGLLAAEHPTLNLVY